MANIITYFKRAIIVLYILLLMTGRVYGLRLPEVPPERCISIHGFICEEENEGRESLLKLTQKLIELDRSEGDIRIYLFSPGGIVQIGFSLVDTIMSLRNDVQIVAHGEASSMAMYILAVGSKGKRAITRHTQIFIHRAEMIEPIPFTILPYLMPEQQEEREWTEEEQKNWWEERWKKNYLLKIEVLLDDILFEHTRVTQKELAEWDDDYIYADTIIKYGIADGIYEGEVGLK